MSQHVQRTIDSPLRSGLTRTQLWEAADKGLIKCWEIGRQRAARFPDLAQQMPRRRTAGARLERWREPQPEEKSKNTAR